MKFNRKKRPKINPETFARNPSTLMEQAYKAYVIAVNAFEEGFEAELREMKKAWEGIEENQPDLNIIKEILGE